MMEATIGRRRVMAVVLGLLVVALAGCVTDNSTAPFSPGDGIQDDDAGSGSGDADTDSGTRPSDTPPDDGVGDQPEGNVRLTLNVPDRFQPGTSATWVVLVEHEGGPGDEPFPYSSICHDPLRVTLHGEGGEEFPLTEPMPECLAYGTAHLEPGDSIERDWDWNVTYWTGNGYRPLHAGTYHLEFRFERQDEQDGRGGGPTGTHTFEIG